MLKKHSVVKLVNSILLCFVLMIISFPGLNCSAPEPMSGHSGAINSIAVTPDGKYLFSAGLDKAILVWRLSTGKVVKNYVGHNYAIHDLYVSKDGKYLASASGDETARVWEVDVEDLDDIKDGDIEVDGSYGVMEESKRIVECCAISPNNEYLLTGDDEYEIKISSLGGSIKGRALYHRKPIFSIVVSGDSNYAYTGSEDYQIYKWNLKKIIDSDVDDYRIIPEQTLSSHIGDVYTLALSKDDKYLVSAGKDSTIKVWSAKKGKMIRTISDQLESREGRREINIINSLAITLKNRYIIAGYEKGNVVKVWDLPLIPEWGRNNPRAHGYGHTKEVNDVLVVPGGKLLASCSDDTSIILWKFNPRKWSKNPADKNLLKVYKKLRGVKKPSTIRKIGGGTIRKSGSIRRGGKK